VFVFHIVILRCINDFRVHFYIMAPGSQQYMVWPITMNSDLSVRSCSPVACLSLLRS